MEALAAVDGILGRNALEFYKLEGRGGFSASTDSLSKLNAAAGHGSVASFASMERTPSFAPRLPPSVNTLAGKSIKDGNLPKTASPRAPKTDVEDLKVLEAVVVEEKSVIDPSHVKHVRLLFADSSGQRRCRVSVFHVLFVKKKKTLCGFLGPLYTMTMQLWGPLELIWRLYYGQWAWNFHCGDRCSSVV